MRLRLTLPLPLLTFLVALALVLPGTAAAKNCGDRYGRIAIRNQPGVVVLSHRGLSCKTIRAVALRLLKQGRTTGRVDGLKCRRDPKVQAGGGATRCTLGPHRRVEYGWE